MATKQPFKPGDKVTSAYDPENPTAIRVVKKCWADPICRTGWLVTLEPEVKCPHCGRELPEIDGIDSNWCKMVHQPRAKRRA